MYIISVVFKSAAHVAQFHYKAYEDADAYMNVGLDSDQLVISDDFGSKAILDTGSVASIVLTDLDAELEAQNTCNLARANAQAKMQRAMQNDPALRLMTPPQFNQGHA